MGLSAQSFPDFVPEVTFSDKDGLELGTYGVGCDTTMNAPVTGLFRAMPRDVDGFLVYYAWKVKTPSSEVAYGNDIENVEVQFNESGLYTITLEATLEKDGNSYLWPDEGVNNTFKVTITPSALKFPNAFSPNGDGTNDVFRATQEGDSKPQSLLSFEAIIFNRWGQKLYSWTNPEEGWDGTYNGKVVKDGVYFLRCVAKGADGVRYDIRKAINVMTGYTLEER